MTLTIDNLTELNDTQPTIDVLNELQQLTETGIGNHFQHRNGFYHIQVIDSDLRTIQLVCEDNINDQFNTFVCVINGRVNSLTN